MTSLVAVALLLGVSPPVLAVSDAAASSAVATAAAHVARLEDLQNRSSRVPRPAQPAQHAVPVGERNHDLAAVSLSEG
jgi:hypothetical protein